MLSTRQAAAVLADEWDRAIGLLAAARPSGWRQPTPCEGWAVRDLVAHCVWGVSLEADALRRARTGTAGPAEADLPAAATDPFDLLAGLLRAHADLLSEVQWLADTAEPAPVPMPYGAVPSDLALQVFVMEAGVHTADLARAFEAEATLSAEVVEATQAALRVFLPVLARTGEQPAAGTVVALRGRSVDLRLRFDGTEWGVGDWSAPTTCVTAPDDSTILLFVLGRLSHRHPALSAECGTAAAVKRWFPGP